MRSPEELVIQVRFLGGAPRIKMKNLIAIFAGFIMGCAIPPSKPDEFCYKGYVAFVNKHGDTEYKQVNGRVIGCNYPNNTKIG
jgi:hypothetical protein